MECRNLVMCVNELIDEVFYSNGWEEGGSVKRSAVG